MSLCPTFPLFCDPKEDDNDKQQHHHHHHHQQQQQQQQQQRHREKSRSSDYFVVVPRQDHQHYSISNNSNNSKSYPNSPSLSRVSSTHSLVVDSIPEHRSIISSSTATSNSSSGCFWRNPQVYWNRPASLFEDILTQIVTMGACMSGGGGSSLIEVNDGGEKEYHERFIEDRVLGEGEFGVVTLVHDMKGGHERSRDIGGANNEDSLACKTLRKGVVFKDNTLYSPVKPEVLQREVNILRKLEGREYCLKMVAVFETPRAIYLVTDFCAGGDTFQYVSKQEEDLRTDDVSRVAFQLLSAVKHCAVHNIIHRDIKPENIMFLTSAPGSDLRLIDFGSGTDEVAADGTHSTFAGSAFYISPELYQRTYTTATDVWSSGVCLYVLVAGYPANKLQRAFNMIQQNERDLKKLPNMPDDVPDSFLHLLNEMLVYKYKMRKSAAQLLDDDFVQFHKNAFSVENIMLEAANPNQTGSMGKTSRTQSISIRGSVGRASMFLDYQKFERSLTTLLATILTKKELEHFVSTVHETLKKEAEHEEALIPELAQQKSLDIIKVSKMKEILQQSGDNQQILSMMEKLPGAKLYGNFAFDTALLVYFVSPDKGRRTQTGSSSARAMRLSGGSMRGGSLRGGSMRGSYRNKARASMFKRSGSFSGGRASKSDNGSANSKSRGKRSSVF